jgi:hypothetical protein
MKRKEKQYACFLLARIAYCAGRQLVTTPDQIPSRDVNLFRRSSFQDPFCVVDLSSSSDPLSAFKFPSTLPPWAVYLRQKQYKQYENVNMNIEISLLSVLTAPEMCTWPPTYLITYLLHAAESFLRR